MNSSKDSEFFYFRSEFDKTLRLYFKEAINLSQLPSNLNLNIPVLSCLILLVEREKEIQDFPQSPPERYSKETFLEDIENVGIGVDKTILSTLEDLISLGFVSEGDKDIKPSETAFKVFNFLNNLFPGMQGINFIAYIVQTIDEVHSDRKSLMDGKEAFFQTLTSRGAKKKAAVSAKSFKTEAPKKEKAGVNSKALKERLSQLRKERQFSSGDGLIKKGEVKSVFDKFKKPKAEDVFKVDENPVEEPQVEEEPVTDEAETVSESIVNEPESKTHEDSEPAGEIVGDDATGEDDNEVSAPPGITSDSAEESAPVEEPATDEEPTVVEETVTVKEEPAKNEDSVTESQKDEPKEPEPQKVETENREQTEPEPPVEEHEKIISEEDIEKRISQFEEQLAMTCPICNEGKIVESITEKGKDFYQCSNNLCHFISWAKPFHFSCPVCKNNFLVETILPGGVKGLKCPRATCDFQQEDQKNPELKAKPKKKKKVVRRVKRRK